MVASVVSLRRDIEKAGGVKSVSMGELRDAVGSGRLGKYVIEGIATALAEQGLGVFPGLDSNQSTVVRLYILGTPAAELIEAVRTPGKEQDDVIQRFANGKGEVILNEIKKLVLERE